LEQKSLFVIKKVLEKFEAMDYRCEDDKFSAVGKVLDNFKR
jgi:hypothetical protein